MRFRLVLLTAALALPLMAQAPATDPQALSLAKELVAKTSGDRDQMLGGMSAPMVGFMRQMGVEDPAHAQQLVNEAILPLMREHYDELLSLQAKSYADALSVDDMKATLAFYNTKAGQDLIKAQPALAQARVVGITQWVGALQPEIQARVQKTAKAHGWNQ